MASNKFEVNLVSNSDGAVNDIAKLERRLDQLAKSFTQQNKEAQRGAKLAKGSYAALEKELKDNVKALKQMEIGSKTFDAQKRKVDNLARSMHKAKTAIDSSKQGMSAFGRITDVVGGRVAGLVAGIGLVSGAVRTLGQALENLEQGNEAKRLATIGFEQGLSAGKGNFTDAGDRDRLKGESLRIAGAVGANPGGVAVALGDLKSQGAAGLAEAAEFLEVAASLNPGDLAGAKALAGAALVEKRGTGAHNAEEVIAGMVSAQIASQTTNTLAFGNAFSANTVAFAQSGGFSAEEAREEAAIFSILEPKSADVAATSQKAFARGIRKYDPSVDRDAGIDQAAVDAFNNAATIKDKIAVLEQNDNLRTQFITDLPDEGRDAIVRRLNPTTADAATMAQVRRDVVSGPAAIAQFRSRQADVESDAPFLLQQARSDAQAAINEITANSAAAFDDAAKKSAQRVRAKAFDDNLLGGMASYLHASTFGIDDPGTKLEAMRRGESQTDSRIRQMGRIGQFDSDENDRQQATRELTELLKLAKSQGLDEQTKLIAEVLEGIRETNRLMQRQVSKPEAPPAGPRPLRPAAAAAP